MSELYRDFIDGKADEIINSLGGTITPAPSNAELYRDFLDRKFDDVINGLINVLPIGSASGNPATFNTSLALPLVACKTDFMCTQASGTPSPSNPLPISGVSAIGLTANSTPVSVSLGEERFGGELDVVNGVLTITHEIHKLNDSRWYYQPNDYRFYYNGYQDIVKKPTTSGEVIDGLCECLEVLPFSLFVQPSSDNVISVATNGLFFIKASAYTSETDLLNALGNYQFTFPLATPITIQLSPTGLSSIIGNNSFASDTGTIDIKYRCLPIDLI